MRTTYLNIIDQSVGREKFVTDMRRLASLYRPDGTFTFAVVYLYFNSVCVSERPIDADFRDNPIETMRIINYVRNVAPLHDCDSLRALLSFYDHVEDYLNSIKKMSPTLGRLTASA